MGRYVIVKRGQVGTRVFVTGSGEGSLFEDHSDAVYRM